MRGSVGADDIKASFLSHVREEGIEYVCVAHGAAHDLAEVDPEFAKIHATFVAAHESVVAWIKSHGGSYL